MQLSKAEEKVVDFDSRCQQVAMYLWNGRSVSITEHQLQWYDVSPHQMISELLGWVQTRSETPKHVRESQRDGAYFGDGADLRDASLLFTVPSVAEYMYLKQR
jgi:Cft2 family RNA processing exonuclease